MELILVAAALALVAVLYSSVGHGGASGYLAVMALAGFASEELRPTALVLNVIVSALGTWRFAQFFQWRLFLPFVAASIPAAFIAGRYIHLEAGWYGLALGVVLLYAAVRLFFSPRAGSDGQMKSPNVPVSLGAGAGIGVVSGMIGVGGGIFLSPLLILMRWAQPRQAAAVAAPFILVNSLAALIGLLLHHRGLPVEAQRLGIFAGVVLVAGLFGATIGAKGVGQRMLNRLLAVLLVIAGGKMILTFINAG